MMRPARHLRRGLHPLRHPLGRRRALTTRSARSRAASSRRNRRAPGPRSAEAQAERARRRRLRPRPRRSHALSPRGPAAANGSVPGAGRSRPDSSRAARARQADVRRRVANLPGLRPGRARRARRVLPAPLRAADPRHPALRTRRPTSPSDRELIGCRAVTSGGSRDERAPWLRFGCPFQSPSRSCWPRGARMPRRPATRTRTAPERHAAARSATRARAPRRAWTQIRPACPASTTAGARITGLPSTATASARLWVRPATG